MRIHMASMILVLGVDLVGKGTRKQDCGQCNMLFMRSTVELTK